MFCFGFVSVRLKNRKTYQTRLINIFKPLSLNKYNWNVKLNTYTFDSIPFVRDFSAEVFIERLACAKLSETTYSAFISPTYLNHLDPKLHSPLQLRSTRMRARADVFFILIHTHTMWHETFCYLWAFMLKTYVQKLRSNYLNTHLILVSSSLNSGVNITLTTENYSNYQIIV